jgi:hypothetical protein
MGVSALLSVVLPAVAGLCCYRHRPSFCTEAVALLLLCTGGLLESSQAYLPTPSGIGTRPKTKRFEAFIS